VPPAQRPNARSGRAARGGREGAERRRRPSSRPATKKKPMPAPPTTDACEQTEQAPTPAGDRARRRGARARGGADAGHAHGSQGRLERAGVGRRAIRARPTACCAAEGGKATTRSCSRCGAAARRSTACASVTMRRSKRHTGVTRLRREPRCAGGVRRLRLRAGWSPALRASLIPRAVARGQPRPGLSRDLGRHETPVSPLEDGARRARLSPRKRRRRDKWGATAFSAPSRRRFFTSRGTSISLAEQGKAPRTFTAADPLEGLRTLLAGYRAVPVSGLPRFSSARSGMSPTTPCASSSACPRGCRSARASGALLHRSGERAGLRTTSRNRSRWS